jgi:hypothetical protein
MSNVKKFNGVTKHNINASDMLKAIAEEKPNHSFVICWPEDGSLPTYHSSTGDMPIILMRLQEFIHKYYNGDFNT